MKYGQEDSSGVKVERDCYAEQFADPGSAKFNYMVSVGGDVIDEDEDPRKLAERINALGSRLVAIARQLERAKVKP